MKYLLLPIALSYAFGAACLGDEPKRVTGQDIVANVKLVVRADHGEKLTEDETGRVQLMVAYIKGFTDGLRPMQVLFPQGPVSIPETVTVGEFARHLDEFLANDKESLQQNCSLVLFNCAFLYYQNPNFKPELIPKRIPIPELTPKRVPPPEQAPEK